MNRLIRLWRLRDRKGLRAFHLAVRFVVPSWLGGLAGLLAVGGLQAQAPTFSTQPASQTVFYGTPATFTVTTAGSRPMAYQWLRDGTAITSATEHSYTLAAVTTADNHAGFSVIVTNALGAVTSAVAVLTVDPGLPGPAVTNQVLRFDSRWKYDETDNLDGVDWTASDYDDAAWPSGEGLLAAENNPAITPLIHTLLSSPRAPPAGLEAGHADYFRTTVVLTNDLLPGPLLATLRCDDGAVLYFNGSEVARVRLPAGPITNLTFATDFPPDPSGGSDATTDELLSLPAWGLKPGTNVIAVSVHQANSGSSDIVWGMGLDVVGYERLPDTVAPTLTELLPADGATVPSLGQIEVHFSEGVQGVTAADLRLNGMVATNVTTYTPDVYVFDFAPPSPGAVQVAWSATQTITDLSANSNQFAGGTYSYTVDPTALAADVRITEFMAANDKTIRDEDGHSSDWIELFNAGAEPVDLGGWYLTDDAANLTKWAFPAGVRLDSRTYLLVWASGNDRTNPAAPLHTNFKLSKDAGSYLALVYRDGTHLVSAFSTYPQQYDDVSYGRDRLDPSLVGYFTSPTPGAPNASVGVGFGPEVHFSVPSGTFVDPFTLELTTDDTNAVIHYLLVTNEMSGAPVNVPTESSLVYTAPLTISGTVQVRARAFSTEPNYFPGPPGSAIYYELSPEVVNFSSDLPIVVFHTMGGGPVAATADQFMTMEVFDTTAGRSALTNPPDLAVSGTFHRRGQATFWNPKANLRVETQDEFGDNLNVPVAGLPAENDWIFYGIDKYDKALMHNPLTHDLYREMGHYSSRTRFVEVYLQDSSGTAGAIKQSDYNGLYVLEEKIKIDKNRVDIDKLQPENTNAPSLTGGYLFSIDKSNPGNPAYLAGAWVWYLDPDYFTLTSPARAAQEQYIQNYFNDFYQALMGPDWTDPAKGYAPYIDLSSWIDYHLVQTLVFNVDALRISAFFYKPRNGPIVQGPLWDFDRCFGTRTDDDARGFNPRRWRSADMDGGTDMFNPANIFNNPWYGRLFTDPDFWQRWIDRYQELRRSVFSLSNLTARINLYGDQVREATAREYARWAGSGGSDTSPRSGRVIGDGLAYTFPRPGTWQGELEFTRWWFSNRVDFMDTNFLNPPSFNLSPGSVVPGSTLTITAPTLETNSTIYYTLNGTDPRLPGGEISPTALSSLNEVTLTLTQNVRVFARDYNQAHRNLTGPGNPPLSSPWSGPTVGTFAVGTPPLRITELMFHPPPPPVGDDDDAEDFEFIEFLNTGTAPIALAGFQLSGGVNFTFPDLTLAAGQYAVIVKDVTAFQARYGTNILIAGSYTNNLSNGGDHLVLLGPLQEPVLDFSYDDKWYPTADGLGFSLVIRDVSAPTDTWGDRASWRPSSEINGSPGADDPAPPALPAIRVNEALTHSTSPALDTIEFFNPTADWADISGWWLTDDPKVPKKYRLPPGTRLSPGGYALFDENEFNVPAQGTNAFALSSSGDQVFLFSADTRFNLTGYAHGFAFGPAPRDITFGRYVDSQRSEQFVLQSWNSLGTNNAYPRVGPVVISEIMYHPPDSPEGVNDTLDEFIELQNVTLTNVPLYDPVVPTSTWELRSAVDFDFPTNQVIAAGGRLLVVGFDPVKYPGTAAAFAAKYSVPAEVPILGPWQGNLNNAGETIELKCPVLANGNGADQNVSYYLVEEVVYSDHAPWPATADGGGASLQRIEPTLFGNDPINWQAALPTAGQPNPVGPEPDVDGDGMPDVWELANGLDPQLNDAGLDPDNDGLSNLQEYGAGTDPHDTSSVLRIESIQVSAWTNTVLRFTAMPERSYTLQWQPRLGAPWEKVADVTAGSGARAVVLTNITDGASVRFYRLITPQIP